jgi:hypothetical protein
MSAVVEPESEVSAADKPEIKDFYTVGRAKATEAEVHLFALSIIGLGHTDKDIRTWASSVADGYGAEFDMFKNSWRPPTKKGEVAAWSKLALVMMEAVKAGKPRLPLCAKATAKILGIDTPSMSALNRWVLGRRRSPSFKVQSVFRSRRPATRKPSTATCATFTRWSQWLDLSASSSTRSAKSTTRRSASCPTTSRR